MTRRRPRPAAVRLAAIGAAIVALMTGLAACGGGPPPIKAPAMEPAAVAVVTGDATSPAAIETPAIETLLNRAFDRNAGFAVVDAGGRPRLFATKLGGTFGNSDAENAALAEQVPAVFRAVDKVIPATSESDPWTAVSEAIGWLHDQGGGTLVVENSGLGTTGFLNYRQAGLLEADPAELVTFARAHHEEPGAAGIKVILLGIGWTAPPQTALSAPERVNLVGQWATLLKAAGAQVSIDQTPLTGPAPASAPTVSLVRATQVGWAPPPGTCGTALNTTELHFIVGTARLQDPPAAAPVVRSVVAELETNHQVATITGTTSSEGGPAINIPLSRKRAQVTAQLMESTGLPRSQVGQVIGVGSHFRGYVPDVGPGGVLLPGPAAENRQVIISWPCATAGNHN
jgi:outer membrane protein OmpA-like peptidoglycan-associated protein